MGCSLVGKGRVEKTPKRPARPRSGAVEKDVCEELILAEELVFASFRQKGREHRLEKSGHLSKDGVDREFFSEVGLSVTARRCRRRNGAAATVRHCHCHHSEPPHFHIETRASPHIPPVFIRTNVG